MKLKTLFVFVFLMTASSAFAVGVSPRVKSGISKNKFFKTYPMNTARSYRTSTNDLWITYLIDGDPTSFHFVDEKLTDWVANDREEMIKEYMEEFVSGNLLNRSSKAHQGLYNALKKLPLDVYLEITDRRHPTIFIDYYTVGIARYAGLMDFTVRPDDPPMFQDGFFILKLGDALNNAQDVRAIEGVIFHELAHRVLNHIHTTDVHVCEKEIEANRLVKSWGYGEEFSLASQEFGSKTKGDSPCQDYLRNKEKEID